MKKIVTLACAAVAGISAVTAQTESNQWAIGVYGGLTEYEGELASNMMGILKDNYSFYGHGAISVNRFLNKRWDVAFFGSYGLLGAKKEGVEYDNENNNSSLVFGTNASGKAEMKLTEIYGDLTAAFKFVTKDSCRFNPYIFAGAGYRYLMEKDSKKYIGAEGGDPVIVAGVGCDFKINDRWALAYTARYGYTLGDDKDQYECGSAKDQQLMHSLGVKFAFGSPKDSDKDGVEDKLDKCPNTPLGVTVDANGCPLDEDKDGVPDYLDKCPSTPAGVQVDTLGCPIDKDGDGVADYLDKCADTPKEAEVDENGCPKDTDGDGVADYLDKCPGTPAAAKGYVDENGCPTDKDGDGVFDFEDKCPETPGIKENKGCPEIKAEVKQLFKKALNGIQFETGKAKIKGKASFAILDDVVKVMQENPAYKLNIGGHTDNVGKPDKNMQLSKERAASVRDYLISKGVEESRLASAGYGDTQPVADNKTAKGRAENRRVAFVVEF